MLPFSQLRDFVNKRKYGSQNGTFLEEVKNVPMGNFFISEKAVTAVNILYRNFHKVEKNASKH